MHAEYIALSNLFWETIPIQNLLNEITSNFNLKRTPESRIARVWEDNKGSLKQANKEFPQTTPNSKHYGIKYHWFRDKIKELNIIIQHISTKQQKADISKELMKNEFEPNRKLLCGCNSSILSRGRLGIYAPLGPVPLLEPECRMFQYIPI